MRVIIRSVYIDFYITIADRKLTARIVSLLVCLPEFYLYPMRLHIKVKPNSKKDEITIEADGSIRVRIKAPPVEGKANKYLTAYIAEYFGLSKSQVTLLKGETNQFKTLEIDAKETEIMSRLKEG